MAVLSHGGARAAGLVAGLAVLSVQAGDLTVTVTGEDGEPLAHAVAYVEAPDLEAGHHGTERPRAIVDQRDQQFHPHAQAIERGTAVRFPNSDQIRHHVFSFSEAKTFEVPLYAGEPPRPIHFDNTGVVVLGCNIHDHMIGYLLVVPTPVFGSADDGGAIRLTDVPDQPEATLRVWHPELGEDDMGITVPMDGGDMLEVTMDVSDTPPPEPRGLRDRRRSLQDRFE